MGTCEWWMLVTTSAVTLILHTLLLLTLYITLSRIIGRHCGLQESSSPTAQPRTSAGREGPQTQTYQGSSETSSETSEDSGSSPTCPQGTSAEENLNYTCVVFPREGSGPGPTRDYENMKSGTDYVNVDPKKRKVDFWTCSSPLVSKSIEYTEVKL